MQPTTSWPTATPIELKDISITMFNEDEVTDNDFQEYLAPEHWATALYYHVANDTMPEDDLALAVVIEWGPEAKRSYTAWTDDLRHEETFGSMGEALKHAVSHHNLVLERTRRITQG